MGCRNGAANVRSSLSFRAWICCDKGSRQLTRLLSQLPALSRPDEGRAARNQAQRSSKLAGTRSDITESNVYHLQMLEKPPLAPPHGGFSFARFMREPLDVCGFRSWVEPSAPHYMAFRQAIKTTL